MASNRHQDLTKISARGGNQLTTRAVESTRVENVVGEPGEVTVSPTSQSSNQKCFYLCKEEWCRRSLSSSSPHRAETQPTLLWAPPGKIMEIWAMSCKSQLWARLSPLFNLSFLREWTLRLVSRPIDYLLFDRQQQSSPFFPLVQAINHPKIDLVTPPLLQVTYSLLCQMWTHSRDNLLPSLDRWQDEPSHLIKSTEWLSHRELAREHTWRMTKHRTRNTNLCVASAHCHTKQRLSDFSQHVSNQCTHLPYLQD